MSCIYASKDAGCKKEPTTVLLTCRVLYQYIDVDKSADWVNREERYYDIEIGLCGHCFGKLPPEVMKMLSSGTVVEEGATVGAPSS